MLCARDFHFPARTCTLGRNRAVPIACLISQLCRVLNLCSCYLTGYLICRQYPRECYTPVTPFFLLGLYLGSESRSANRLPDFSATSRTEPLLLPSICPPHTQAIPSRALYARDSVLFAWTLPRIWSHAVPIACPISQLHHALNFPLWPILPLEFFLQIVLFKMIIALL